MVSMMMIYDSDNCAATGTCDGTAGVRIPGVQWISTTVDGTTYVTATLTYSEFELETPRKEFDAAIRWWERHRAFRRMCGQRVRRGALAWWPVGRGVRRRSQTAGRKTKGYWAGARDWTRGRHWDRRSRYGLK